MAPGMAKNRRIDRGREMPRRGTIVGAGPAHDLWPGPEQQQAATLERINLPETTMTRLLSLSLLLALGTAAHAAPTPITLEQAMAEPDWIGNPVESAWWAWDSRHIQYTQKRAGSPVRDTFQITSSGGTTSVVDGPARGDLDTAQRIHNADNTQLAFVRDGNVFLRDLRSGVLQQISHGNDNARGLAFSHNGGLVWHVNHTWYHWTPAAGTRQVAQLRSEKDPDAAPVSNSLREQQLATLETLRRDRANREALKQQAAAWRAADPTRPAAPVYLGEDVVILDSALSPDADILLVVTRSKKAEAGQGGRMPLYVTESGYEEFENVRTRVGRNDPAPHRLWQVELASGKVSPVSFDALPGIATDPLAELRKAAGKEALKGNRDVQVGAGFGSPSMIWNADGSQAAVMLRSVDNKDRWIATFSPGSDRLAPRHRLTDPAWINWNYNDFGWLPDGRTLWLLSEQSGYSHLYTQAGNARPQALTGGNWEASMPVLSADGSSFYFLCNQAWPGDYEVCNVSVDGGAVREVTALDGVEDFSLSPDGNQVLVRFSASYTPQQLAVVPAAGGQARQLTDTRSAEFKARSWVEPQMVKVPSSHGAGHIWAKYYGPETLEPGRQYPIVMFVHGAGYLQNVHARYPTYFREQMFHNLLVQEGYIVLDMDFRASEGYGRNWRTAIYRNMGHPELEDYQDGLDWLVENKQGDRERAGIYGGSYGGFLTFMALFRSPGTFKAGAALRPVGDWMQYNHAYTSNILNTPDIDPQAYRTSSPIHYAEGLQDHLFIGHGMMDDNVFFQDSVNLSQRLIELRKDHWNMTAYPLERHGYTRSDSWYDQYRRIHRLFGQTLKP